MGFAGFRVHFPVNTPAYKDEVLVFLGASYFRGLGQGQRFGLSARGLAIDTAENSGEEFPRFVEFWIERPQPNAKELTVYALLDSPRADRGLPLRAPPGRDDGARRRLQALPAKERRQAGTGAADQHVLLRRQPAVRARRLPAAGPRLRRPVHPGGGRRLDLAPAGQSQAAAGDVVRAERSGRLRPDAARTLVRPATRTSRRDTTCGPRRGSSRRGRGDPAASSWCRSPCPTRPTTTSSPTGCPTGSRSPGALGLRLSLAVAEGSGDRGRPMGVGTRDAPRPRVLRKATTGASRCTSISRGRRPAGMPPNATVDAAVWLDTNGEVLDRHLQRNEATGGWRFVVRFRRLDKTNPWSCGRTWSAARRSCRRRGATFFPRTSDAARAPDPHWRPKAGEVVARSAPATGRGALRWPTAPSLTATRPADAGRFASLRPRGFTRHVAVPPDRCSTGAG